MAGRPLLHEFGEDAGLVGGVPLGRQFGEQPRPHVAPRPVGDDLVGVDFQAVVIDEVAGLGAGAEDPQVFEGMAGQLRISGDHLGRGAALADDQLIFSDVDCLVLAEVKERLGPHNRHGIQAVVGGVEFGHQPRPFGTDPRHGVETLFSQAGGSFVHALTSYTYGKPAGGKPLTQGFHVFRVGLFDIFEGIRLAQPFEFGGGGLVIG